MIKEYHTKTGKRIRLIHGDCMEWMKGCEKYDLAIVDPPYGISMDNQVIRQKPNRPNTHGRGGEKQYNNSRWDNSPPDDEYFDCLYKKSDNQIIWGANYFCDKIKPGFGWVFWDKQMGDNNFSSGEFAFQSIQVRSASVSIPSMRVNGTRLHPTEKPVKLYRWLLQNYASEGDRILDTHGGSMSHAIACWEEDFELDIIELDDDYYKSAVKRFEQHISQTALF